MGMFSYIRGRHGRLSAYSIGGFCILHMFVYPLYICMPLYHPVHLYVPPYHMFLICHGDFGASVHPICLGVFGGHQYICQAFLCLSVPAFASQFITVILIASHHCRLHPYWTGFLWMSAMLHAVVPFFVVFSLCLNNNTGNPLTAVQIISNDSSSLIFLAYIENFYVCDVIL